MSNISSNKPIYLVYREHFLTFVCHFRCHSLWECFNLLGVFMLSFLS